MKKRVLCKEESMKKVIRNIVIVLYAIIAIAVTVCLLSYNEYKVTMFGQTSLVIIDNDKLEPDYNKGDLVIVDGSKEIKSGDKIFFYNKQLAITLAEVTKVEVVTETQTTYTLEGNVPISSDYVIGKTETSKTYGKVGAVLGVLESQWGFLLLVVLPAVIAFLYEIFAVITEVRGNKGNEEESKDQKRGQGRRSKH